MSKPIRVGFDLDGVILYNPARIIRPLIKTWKAKVKKTNKVSFFVPQNRAQVLVWDLLHKSSMFPAKGLDDITTLVQTGKIQAYIITARFGHLDQDTNRWFKKLNRNQVFTKCIRNQHNKQPHIFKAEMASKYQLHYFVEDNFDIVSHLSQQANRGVLPLKQVLWISNLLDYQIKYPFKYPNLKQAVVHLKSQVK